MAEDTFSTGSDTFSSGQNTFTSGTDTFSSTKKSSANDVITAKKLSLERTTINIDFSKPFDGDAIMGSRLATPETGVAYDAFETNNHAQIDTTANRKKALKQRKAASIYLDKDENDTTAADIFALGEKGRVALRNAILEGYTIPADGDLSKLNVQVETRQVGTDEYGRPLVEAFNKVTGKSLLDSLNKPGINADYDSKYNLDNKIHQWANTPTRSVGDVIQDTAVTAATAGVSGLKSVFDIEAAAADIVSTGLDLTAAGTAKVDKLAKDHLNKDVYEVGSAVVKPLTYTTDAINKGIKAFSEAQHTISGALTDVNSTLHDIGDSALMRMQTKVHNEAKANAILNSELNALPEDARTRDKAKRLANNFLTEAGVTLSSLEDNPVVAIDSAVQAISSLPLILETSGLMGARAGTKLLSGMTANEAALAHSVAAGAAEGTVSAVTAASLKASSLGSLASIGATEGASASNDIYTALSDTSVDALRKESPYFDKLVVNNPNANPEDLKKDLARQIAAVGGIVIGVASAGISKAVGIDKIENYLKKSIVPSKSFFGNSILSTTESGIKDAGKEIVEEGSQAFTGHALRKLTENAMLDQDKQILSGIGVETAEGAALGSLGSSASSLATRTPETLVNTALESANATGYVAGKVGSAIGNAYNAVTQSQEIKSLNQEVKSSNDSGDYSKIAIGTNIEPIHIVNSLLELPPSSDAKENIQTNYVNKLRQSATEMRTELYDIIDATQDLSDEELSTTENVALVNKRTEMYDLLVKTKTVLDSYAPRTTEEIDASIAEIPANTAPDTKTLGSILPRSNESQLDKLSSMVPEGSVESQMISNRREVLNLEKDSSQVSTEVRDGGTIVDKKGNSTAVLGYKDYQSDVVDAVEASNPEVATKVLNRFSKFAAGLQTKHDLYEQAGNLISTAEYTRASALKKATPENIASVRASQNNLVAQAVTEANAVLNNAGMLNSKGEPVNYKNAQTIHGTKLEIKKDINAVNAAIKESSYLVEGITNRTARENKAVDKVFAVSGTAGLETMKASKQARLVDINKPISAAAASQIKGEISYIDSILSKAPTSTVESKPQQQAVDVTSTTNNVVEVTDIFKVNVEKASDSAIEKSIEKLSKAVDKHTEGTKNPDIKAIQARLDYLLEVRKERLANAPDLAPPPAEVTEIISSQTESVNTEQPTKPKRNDGTEALTKDEVDEQLQQAEDEEGTSPSSTQVNDTINTNSSTTSNTGTESTEVVNEPTGSQNESVVSSILFNTLSKLASFTEFFGLKQVTNPIANNPDFFTNPPTEYANSEEFKRIANFVNGFSNKIESTFNKYSKFGGKETAKLFVNGSIPQEIKNLMAAATYEWMLTMGGKSIYNGAYEIGAILGIPEESVTQLMLVTLGNMGTLKSVAAISIGKQVLREAGITSKSLEVSEEYFENLAGELGLICLNAMVNTKKSGHLLAEFHTLSAEQKALLLDNFTTLADITESTEITDKNNIDGMQFISLGAVEDTTGNFGIVPNAGVEELLKEGNSLVKLLNNIQRKDDTRPQHILTKPSIKNISKYMKGTIQKVPMKMLKIAVKYMQQENYIDRDNADTFAKLSPEFQRKALGYKAPVNNKLQVIESSLKRIQSVNSGIALSLQKWNEFVVEHTTTSEGLATPFYLPSEFWKQMRLGMNSSTVNTQTDKLHRALITRNKPHIVAFNDTTAMQLHVRALAQAFGVKTDDLNPFDMPTDILTIINEEELDIFKSAAKAINEAGDSNFTKEQSELIVEAIEKGGEGMHTYSGIVALAKQLKASESDSASFETTLTFEVDGKTNGVIIGILQLAGAKDLKELKLRMAKGGIFTDGKYNSYHEYKSEGNEDTYEAFGSAWRVELNELVFNSSYDRVRTGNSITIMQGLENLIGSLNNPKHARKLAKPPVTKNAFGAGSKGITYALEEEVLAKIEDEINKNIDDLIKLNEIAANIKAVTGISHTFNDKNKLDALPINITKSIISVVKATYSKSLEMTLQTEYKEFIYKRSLLNTAMKLTFKALEFQYVAKLNEIEKENIAAGKTGITKSQRDGILKSIQGVSPVIKSYFSQSVEDSIVAYKEAKVTIDKEHKKAYTAQASSTQSMTVHVLNGDPYTTSSSSAVAAIDYVADPGVAAVIQMVHSLDSATMMLALEELIDAGIPVLNIFDATVTSANDSKASHVALNGAFQKVMQEYNMMDEFLATYERVLKALPRDGRLAVFDTLLNDKQIKSFRKKVNDRTGVENSLNSLKEFGDLLRNEVKNTKELKDGLFDALSSMNQYIGVAPPIKKTVPTDTKVETKMTKVEEEEFSNNVNSLLDEAVKEEQDKKGNDTDALGSTTGGIDPNSFQSDIDITLSENNINYVMEKLGKASTTGVTNTIDPSTHVEYLSNYISKIASEVSPKIKGLVLRTRKSIGSTEGVQTGKYILLDVGTSPAINLTTMSAQEVFAHELTHSITEYGLRNDSLLRNQVERLKDRVMNYLLKQANPIEYFLTYDSNGNILTTNGNTAQQEIEAAQERFNYIFGLDNSGKSWITKASITGISVENHNNNSIHEFVAFGRTNAKFIELLASEEMNKVLRTEFSSSVWNKNVFITLGNIFNKLTAMLVGKLTASKSLNADTQLDILVGKLSKVVNRNDSMFQEFNPLHERISNKAITKLQKLLVATAYVTSNSKFVKNTTQPVIAATGKVVSKIQHLPYQAFRSWAKNTARRIGISDRNFAIAFMRETIRGRTKDNSYLYNFVSAYKHGIDQARNDIRTRAAKNLLTAFAGTKLTNSMKTVLLKTVVKLELFLAVSEYGMPVVQHMLADNNVIDNEITNLHSALKAITSVGTFEYFNKMSRSLGNRLVHGEGTEHLDYLSAKAIVNSIEIVAPTNLDEAERIVDLLATLHGMKVSSKENKIALNTLITSEYAKTTEQLTEDGENGIQYLLEYAKDLRDRSRDELFSGNSTHMEKGYTKDLIDPKVQFIVATPEEALAQRLTEQGYVLKAPIHADNAHKAAKNNLGIYINNFSVSTSRISSSFSVMEDSSRGTLITDTPVDEIVAFYKNTVASQATSKNTSVSKVAMAPVRNLSNEIVGFRYMMNEATKDSIMKKNNSFEQVMGAMEADLSIKPAAKANNVNIIHALYTDYKANVRKDPKAYVAIGPQTTDKELKDIYRLLPREAKQAIKDTFGDSTMHIREQDVRLVFGYKKFSIGQFDKHWTPEQKTTATVVEKTGMKIAELLNTKFVLRGAHMWEYTVKTAKDIIVIKTGAVLVANVASNNGVLWTKGLTLKMIAAYQLEAIENFNKYQKDINTVKNIEMRIRLNPSLKSNSVVMGKLSNAKSATTNNPIKNLLDAGVFQSIIEDVEAEDVFSYRAVAEEYIGKFTDKIPQPLKTFGNVMILSHDTRAYKALKVTTQMSDFVARYALHKFNMDQISKDGSKKFTEQSSIEDINDTFILYDVPTSPGMQAFNDSGILMFTKYALRIKKVLVKAAIRAPGRALNTVLLSEFVTGMSNMYDSAFNLPNFGNVGNVLDAVTDIPALELAIELSGNGSSGVSGSF